MTEPVEPPPLSIGEFARRSRLSLKALRLYEQRGLLRPARVDPHTGYRWYRESQLFTARLIAMLRMVDMPLAQVAEPSCGPAWATGNRSRPGSRSGSGRCPSSWCSRSGAPCRWRSWRLAPGNQAPAGGGRARVRGDGGALVRDLPRRSEPGQ